MISPSGICNLGCKFCAYRHKERPKRVMSNERFFALVDQATQMGYTQIGLTPMTGDVYTDPDFVSKLSFLEEHPAVEAYYFYTNLTLPTHDRLRESLTDCDKLVRGERSLYVSVYGHDEDSFSEITGRGEREYRRLVSNLNFLSEFVDDPEKVEVGFRTYDDTDPIEIIDDRSADGSEVLEAVRDLRDDVGVQVTNHTGVYNNWGGTVSDEDVEDIDMEVSEAKLDKDGPCQLIFNKNIILPDGKVNACACRDVEATLCLGDTNENTLDEILSPSANETYRRLITRHDSGDFPEICRTCDMYQSIREPRSGPRVDLEEFYRYYDPQKDEYDPERKRYTSG